MSRPHTNGLPLLAPQRRYRFAVDLIQSHPVVAPIQAGMGNLGVEVYKPRNFAGLPQIHGITGFKRYVALAVLTRNIHRIGAILWQQDLECEQRKSRYGDRDKPKLAA